MQDISDFLNEGRTPERPRTGLIQCGIMHETLGSSAWGDMIRVLWVHIDAQMAPPAGFALDEIQMAFYFLADGPDEVEITQPRPLPGRRKLRLQSVWHYDAWAPQEIARVKHSRVTHIFGLKIGG